MSTSKQRLYHLLAPLKLYSLRSGAMVEGELAAYLAVFLEIEQKLVWLRSAMFAAEADGQQLKRWERMVGIPVKEEVPLEERRRMVLQRLSVAAKDNTREGLKKALASAGVQAEIQEVSTGKLRISSKGIVGGHYTLDEVKQAVERFLPSHLEVEFDFGSLTWEMFNQKDKTFAQWDEKDITWEYFDLNGEML